LTTTAVVNHHLARKFLIEIYMAMRICLYLLCIVALFVTTAANATWRVAETAHFRVYGEQSEALLRERAVLLEDYSALLRMLTDGVAEIDGAPRLDIFLVGSVKEARPFGTVGSNVAGFYAASPGRIAAYSELGEFGKTILLHEYTHHFMLGGRGVAYPRWYVEGFAEYFSTALFKAKTIEFGGVSSFRAMQLVRGNWLPLQRVLANDPKLKGADETSAYYAESWLLTHYLHRVPGQSEKLRAYLRAVAGGADSLAAFQQHVDPDIRAFELRLKSYLKGSKITYSRFDRPASTPASVSVTTLSPAADPLLLMLTSLEFSVPSDPAKALASIGTAAARFPADPLAERTLAFAELRLGDRQRAATLIDALLARAPADATLLRWRAMALAPLARDTSTVARGEARRLLVRASRADPGDWRTMLLYSQIAGLRGGAPIASDLNVMLRTHELAPQVDTVVLTTAALLAQADRLPEAAVVLEPLANSPHDSGAARFAGTLLERARAGDKPGFLVAMRQPETTAANGED
jgi:hypothetical protein